MKKIFALICIALVAIDQVIKIWVLQSLKPIGSFSLIPNLLELSYVENRGASFGMFQNMSHIFAILTTIMMIIILVLYIKFKEHNFFSHYAAICIISGGIGNLIDRLMLEFVVDYIHVMFFPYIFNFADCLVVTGAISFFVFYIFYYGKKDNKLGESDLSGKD